ncbi:HD family phosphohydrolase [Clostridium manihotivorum]
MSKEKGISFKFINNPKRIIMFVLTFLIAYLCIISSLVTKKYDLKEGDISKVDIKAPREIVDQDATTKRQQAEADKYGQQYTLKTDIQKDAEDNLRTLFNKISALKDSNIPETDKISQISKLTPIKLDNDEISSLLGLSKDNLNELLGVMLDGLKKSYEKNIQEDKPSDLQSSKSILDNQIANINYNRNIKDILRNIGYYIIKPNLFFDKDKTEEKKKEAIKEVAPIVIKKNQTIVKEGEPVTEDQIKILDSLGLLNKSDINFIIYISTAFFVATILSLQFRYLKKYYKAVYDDNSKLLLISIVNITSLILARAFAIVSPFLIPLACAPILLTLLVNYKVSLFLSVLNCILIAGAVNFNAEAIVLSFLVSILASTSLRKIEQRNDILYSTLFLSVIGAIVTFTQGIILSNNILDILMKSGFVIIGCLFSGVMAVGLLPFFESTFDVVTTVKLLELSNPNNPLLKKLLMEAPGTYHHSMMVANLSEVAAEEVGGNPVLARIGSYYHDVGKTRRPYFFKENQIGKENPHDKITPNLSTLIIISHVKDGLELAREYNLPKVIRDIIEQHHGTTLVKYFYITMKNNAENPDEIKEEDFRYPGPKPESKEAGIIMLADSVEASVRSISDPTKGKIDEMVNKIVKDKLYSGELDNCDLTLKDINKISKCFLKVLNGIYHQRIEYPTEKDKI